MRPAARQLCTLAAVLVWLAAGGGRGSLADFQTCMREGAVALEERRFADATGRADRVLVQAFDRWPDDPELRAWMEGMDVQGEERPGNSGSSK